MEWVDKTPVTLSTFGAANLLRIPSMPASDVDVYSLAETVSEMKQRQESLRSSANFCPEIADRVDCLPGSEVDSIVQK